MADQRQSLPFEPKSSPKVQGQSSQQRRSQQAVRQEAIPKPVANRGTPGCCLHWTPILCRAGSFCVELCADDPRNRRHRSGRHSGDLRLLSAWIDRTELRRSLRQLGG